MDNKTLAIIALVFAIIFPIVGLILGIIALIQIKKQGGREKAWLLQLLL